MDRDKFGGAAIFRHRSLGQAHPNKNIVQWNCSIVHLTGLEAEIAVVLNTGGLDARNLYVPITRGSKALTICS
jgi:hypothetical protein